MVTLYRLFRVSKDQVTGSVAVQVCVALVLLSAKTGEMSVVAGCTRHARSTAQRSSLIATRVAVRTWKRLSHVRSVRAKRNRSGRPPCHEHCERLVKSRASTCVRIVPCDA